MLKPDALANQSTANKATDRLRPQIYEVALNQSSKTVVCSHHAYTDDM